MLCSLSWLQVLYHCLSHVPGMAGAVIDAIPDKNQLLLTCCSLLISNRKSSVSTQLEKVLQWFVGLCNATSIYGCLLMKL